jgi:hypothetical protein
MWFKRKPQPAEPEAPERRGAERRPPRRFQDYFVRLVSLEDGERSELMAAGYTLVTPFQEPVKVRLLDLCIQGSSVLVGTAVMPSLRVGEVVGLSIEHAFEDWSVIVAASTRSIADESEVRTRIGFEFLEPGDLQQQQLDMRASALGHFNRRRGGRVPFSIEPREVRVACGRRRLFARVIDISEFGIGVLANHVEAAGFQVGERVEYHLPLPGLSEPIQGAGRIVRTVRRGKHDLLGIAFAVRGGTLNKEQAEALAVHVQTYLDKRLRWSA